MNKYIVICLFLVFMCSCKKKYPENKTKESLNPEKNSTISSSSLSDCYQANINGNTINLSLNNKSNAVSGTLRYSFSGKEIFDGKFKGIMVGNLLVADYSYVSEGKTGERQIVFKFKENQWLEGYGERQKNSTKFKNIATLQFNENLPLTRIDCP